MKRVISVFLLFQIVFQLTGGIRVLINHELFSDYIATVLCVKKDVAGNDCHGECHKMKTLKQEKEKDEKQDKAKELQLVTYVLADNPEFSCEIVREEQDVFKPYRQGYSYLFGNKGFHPPRNAA